MILRDNAYEIIRAELDRDDRVLIQEVSGIGVGLRLDELRLTFEELHKLYVAIGRSKKFRDWFVSQITEEDQEEDQEEEQEDE